MNNHNLVMWKLAEKESMSVSINISENCGRWKKDRHRQWTQNLILDMILEYKLLAMEKRKFYMKLRQI